MKLPDLDTLPPELRAEVEKRRNLHVYHMLMHSPGLAPGFLALADAILQTNALPPDLRELAIVRVGHAYQAAYEIHHHERIGRLVGVSERALAACAVSEAVTGLTEREQDILRWTDTLLADHVLAGAERDRALAVLGPDQLMALVVTVGFYQLVCNLLNTFEVQIEPFDPFASQLERDSLFQRVR
jgi:alkylhydroperoxidase family enzyme